MRLDDEEWVISCEPHVRMRLKALFGRVHKGQFDEIRVAATDEASRDLEWFLLRYPMVAPEAAEMARRARSYDTRAARSARIIEGEYQLPSSTAMALPPRDYQLQAGALVLANGNLLLVDELGLGKSCSALTVLSDPAALPALVVCMTNLTAQWVRECAKFLPGLRCHVASKMEPYDLPPHDVLVISYHKISGWADAIAGHYRAVVFDEVQELRHHKSLRYNAATHVASRARYVLGLTATPIYNLGGEYYNVVSVLRGGLLGTRDEFLREWCHGYVDRHGRASLRDPDAFGAYLREAGVMLRRTRKMVGRELPPVSRIVEEVNSDPKALEDVEDAACELANIILTQNKGWDVLKASQELSATLRQATGVAKAPYVAHFVRMLLEEGEDSVALFGWHREVYGIWESLLADFKPAWYTGSEDARRKDKEAQRFMKGETRLMIMSLRSGAGLDGLQTVCSTPVFGELDWSLGALEQCVGRFNRDGQRRPVFAYYLVARDGADPVIQDTLGLKKIQLEGVLDPGGLGAVVNEVDPDHVKHLAEAYLRRLKRPLPARAPDE